MGISAPIVLVGISISEMTEAGLQRSSSRADLPLPIPPFSNPALHAFILSPASLHITLHSLQQILHLPFQRPLLLMAPPTVLLRGTHILQKYGERLANCLAGALQTGPFLRCVAEGCGQGTEVGLRLGIGDLRGEVWGWGGVVIAGWDG